VRTARGRRDTGLDPGEIRFQLRRDMKKSQATKTGRGGGGKERNAVKTTKRRTARIGIDSIRSAENRNSPINRVRKECLGEWIGHQSWVKMAWKSPFRRKRDECTGKRERGGTSSSLGRNVLKHGGSRAQAVSLKEQRFFVRI